MLLSALVALAAVLNVVAQPEVRPPSLHFQHPGSGALTCVFETPLTDCRLRVSDHHGEAFDSVLEFPLGPQSPSVALPYNTGASYFGEGLHRGHCGVQLRMSGEINPVVLVECFGRAGNGTWSRGFGTLTASAHGILPVTSVPPSSISAGRDADVSVLMQTRDGRALDGCFVWTPAAGQMDLSPGQSPHPGSRYRGHGAGAAGGECGAVLASVQPNDSGVWRWYGYRASPKSLAWHATVMLVQVAPWGLPVMEVRGPSTVGSLLEATCVAPPSVPPARLSWWLGDRVLRDDAGNETAPADIAKSRPWEKQATVQTFRRVLQAKDHGQRLECRMNHEALWAAVSVGHQLTLADVTPGTTPIPSMTTAAATPIKVRAESAVVHTAVGHHSELACIVNVLGATVRWSHATGLPVQTSSLVIAGHNKKRHWLVFEDTAAEDLSDFTCQASKEGSTASQVVRLTGLPGTPQWVGNATHIAWKVQSVAPVTGALLKLRRGTGKWQEFTDLHVTEMDERWHRVTSERLPVTAGRYTAHLKVRNEYGWSSPSRVNKVTLDAADDGDLETAILDVDVRQGEVAESVRRPKGGRSSGTPRPEGQ